VRRDDERGMTLKVDDDDGWSSDDVVLWLVKKQNKDVIEW
jgi:hypothetical protein